MSLWFWQEVQAVSREAGLKPERDRVSVVAGILIDSRDQVLIADRSRSRSLREFYEFPGGKVAQGESAEAALARELSEELGITVLSASFFDAIAHDYPDIAVSVAFFRVDRWEGEPAGLEGQRIRWVKRASLHEEKLLPADLPVVQKLASLRANRGPHGGPTSGTAKR